MALNPGDLSKIQRNEEDLAIRKAAIRNELSNKILTAKRNIPIATEKVFTQVGQFAGTAAIGQSFTPEQQALSQMFGQGEKVWGFPESRVVQMNHDLNPRQRGDEGTASLFGFGNEGERSGLF